MAALALEDRVSALEQLLAQLSDGAVADSITPTSTTVDPSTGAIGADFTGHVHAQGLDLDAGTSSTPPTQDRVRWLRTSDGALVADLFGFSNGAIENLELRAVANPPADSATLTLLAWSSDFSGDLASMSLNRGGDSPVILAQVQNSAGVQSVRLIDSAGLSSFPQNVAGPIASAVSRPSQAQRSADVSLSVTGWHQVPFDQLLSNADNLLVNAGGYELQAPSAGWYEVRVRVGAMNATGGVAELIIGWNSAAILARTAVVVPNNGDVWLDGTETFNLAQGAVIQPTVFLNPGTGFGWTLRAGSTFTAKRIA